MKTMVYFGRTKFLPEIPWEYSQVLENKSLEDRIRERYSDFYRLNEKFIEDSTKLIITQTERLIKIVDLCNNIQCEEIDRELKNYRMRLVETSHILHCDIEEAFIQSLSISSLDQSSRKLEGKVLKGKIGESYSLFSAVNEDFCNYLIDLSSKILLTAPHNSHSWLKDLQMELNVQHGNYYEQTRKMMRRCFQTLFLV